MTRTRRWPLVALVAWTIFVWGNRISNAWRSTTETTGAKVSSTVVASSFLLLALAGLVIVVRAWRRPLLRGEAVVLAGFAGWTVAVWLVRMVGIVLADHAVGFKIVHVALGVVSIVLAALVARVARSETAPSPGLVSPSSSAAR